MLHDRVRDDAAQHYVGHGMYTGTDAIEPGVLMVFDMNYGTATDEDAERTTRITRPLYSEAAYLRQAAGVTAQRQGAKAQGQEVKLNLCGSICRIATLAAPTLGDLVTALADAATYLQGKFVPGKLPGRGSATVLRTVAAITSPTDHSVGWFSNSTDGSATYTSSSKTVTKTAAFAGVPATANLTGNEYIHVVAGATDNAGAAASIKATQGRYKITAKTSDDAVVVESAIASADIDIAFFCVRGNPTVIAHLHGTPDPNLTDESGLAHWISPETDGSGGTTGGALMTGGLNCIFGGFDLDNGNCTHALADGTFAGQQVLVTVMGAITTSDVAIAATSSNINAVATDPADSTLGAADIKDFAIATIALDGATDHALLRWTGRIWTLVGGSGMICA